jgi:hypothetical protein
MTSPTETVVNGTQDSYPDASKTSSPQSQQTTVKPKTNGVNGSAKVNGLITDGSTTTSNGEGSNVTTDAHLSVATPASSMSGSQPDIMEQIPFGDSQQGQSEQGDQSEEERPELKKDLYVGNLYNSHASNTNLRHPRVQLEMLKNFFGGDACVENVKIVPDRNVNVPACI